MNVIEALEAAAEAHKASEEALRKAAHALACKVERIAPEGVKLPRGYRVVRIQSNVGSAVFLSAPGDESGFINGTGGYLHGDFHAMVDAASQDTLLEFADDVAEGWLDELREFLQARADKAAKGAETLSSATV
jgi:hypothetical protein